MNDLFSYVIKKLQCAAINEFKSYETKRKVKVRKELYDAGLAPVLPDLILLMQVILYIVCQI